MDDMRTSLKLRGLTKSYGIVRALDGVDLDAHGGEVHGLLGANGAGKSTLVKILAGMTVPDEGSVDIAGKRMHRVTPKDAFQAGIRVAHQELAVVPNLTVAEHLLLGRRVGRQERDCRLAASQDLFREWGLDIPVTKVMRDIPPALQACVMLARTLEGSGRVLLLDEPTASLGAKEVTGLFQIIRRKVSEGALVLFVSHRLPEVKQLCTNVTVLRNGKRVQSCPIQGMNEADLEQLITGESRTEEGFGEVPVAMKRPRPVAAETAAPSLGSPVDLEEDRQTGPSPRDLETAGGSTPLLQVEEMQLDTRVVDVSFQLVSGEILGLAGLVGSGRTEVLEALMGLRPLVGGRMALDGVPYAPRNPYTAMQHGLALVPEERARQAMFLQQDIGFNFASARFRAEGRGRGGWRTAWDEYDKTSQALATSLRVKPEGLRAGITSMSGGNQQKVVLGRFLLPGLRVLLLDEPTRGVDVGARRDFQRVIRDLADRGLGIIYVSSELGELESCDRIVVMVQGQSTGDAPTGDEFDEEELTKLCFRPRASVGL